jgi:hypothetical protein
MVLGSSVGLARPAVADAPEPIILSQSTSLALAHHATHIAATLVVRVGGTNGDGTIATVSVFRPVATRSAADAVLNGVAPTGLLSSTGSFPLDCRTNGVAQLLVTLARGVASAPACGGADLALNLHCPSSCAGVYPLLLTITAGGNTTPLWTFLTLTAESPNRPLNVAVVDLVANGNGAASTVRRLADVAAPLTLAPTSAVLDGSLAHPDFGRALVQFVSVATHHVVTPMPTDLDLGALRSAGLATDVARAITLQRDLVHSVAPGSRVDDVVVTDGLVSPASLNALAAVGVRRVLLNEHNLTTTPSATLRWGGPFVVSGVTRALTAAATDSGLRDALTRRDIEPARLAALAVGELNLLYYEAPNLSATRGVALVLPSAAVSATTVATLVNDLRVDHVVHLTDTDALVRPVLLASHHSPSTRALTAAPAAVWTAAERTAAHGLGVQSVSLAEALADPTITMHLDELRLRAEAGLGPHGAALAAVNARVIALTQSFHVADVAITTSDSGTPLPITISSTAGYLVTGVLHLRSTTIRFPAGNAIPVSLINNTTISHVVVTMPSGSSGILDARFTTPDGRVTLAFASIQVHSAATSLVGYLLTGLSLAVIGWWWVLTNRRKRHP